MQQWTGETPLPPPNSQYVIRADAANSPGFRRQVEHDSTGWPHSRPGSTLIAPMGNHWGPGAWQHVMDMMKFALDAGYHVEFQEIQDRCFEYADALGTMRNEAGLIAQNRGLEWTLLYENDIWPPANALVDMVEWFPRTRANLIAPYIVETGSGMPLHGPDVGANTGFQWMKWSVLSMLLIKTSVLARYPGGFWRDCLGADEGYHFQQWYLDGYYLGMATDLQVPCLRRPQYPLATNTLDDRERKRHWDYRNAMRQRIPDRRPIDPQDLHIDANGNYNPFIQLGESNGSDKPGSEQGAPVTTPGTVIGTIDGSGKAVDFNLGSAASP